MSKCIPATLSDGTVVMANVDYDVTELDPQDIQALEEWIAMVKARHAKRKPKKKTVDSPDMHW